MTSQPFAKRPWYSRGYSLQEVDRFFTAARAAYERQPGAAKMRAADVRGIAFKPQRGGYDMAAVDRALDRLETSFVRQERADNVAAKGQQEWLASVADRATTLYPRLLRPRGQRFSHPDGRGYSATQVDDFLDKLAKFFDDGIQMTAEDVRYQTFASARGGKAYTESVVDAYLSRAIEVLTAVE